MITRPCLAAMTVCLGITACAAPPAATDVTMITAPGKQQSIRTGQSTKADVVAALGSTKILRFDSGFEVWVYRLDDKPAAEMPGLDSLASKVISGPGSRGQRADGSAEFIVLFARSGVVAKTRVRPRFIAP